MYLIGAALYRAGAPLHVLADHEGVLADAVLDLVIEPVLPELVSVPARAAQNVQDDGRLSPRPDHRARHEPSDDLITSGQAGGCSRCPGCRSPQALAPSRTGANRKVHAMTTLAHINGELLHMPGLTLWGRRHRVGLHTRHSLICSGPAGAVELWAYLDAPDMGGVEFHDVREQVPGEGPEPCDLLPGGRCFVEGSSSLYTRQFLPMITAGESREVCEHLTDLYVIHHGGLPARTPAEGS